jgi:hypothetical protein
LVRLRFLRHWVSEAERTVVLHGARAMQRVIRVEAQPCFALRCWPFANVRVRSCTFMNVRERPYSLSRKGPRAMCSVV